MEGFAPAIAKGTTEYRPYWDAKSKFIPYLKVVETIARDPSERTASPKTWITDQHQKLFPAPNADAYLNPTNMPGDLSPWRIRGAWNGEIIDEIEIDPESTGNTGAFDLLQGESLFAIDATIKVEVDEAEVANLWVVGMGTPPFAAISQPSRNPEGAGIIGAFNRIIKVLSTGNDPAALPRAETRRSVICDHRDDCPR